jgi:choice-of-anchor A domain-containing protein
MIKLRGAFMAITIAVSVTAAMAQTCPGSANSTLINFLGSAGPSNYAVLSLGGPGALVNINLGSVSGDFANIGVPNSGTFKESAPSSVAGNIIVGSLVNTAGAIGAHGPILVNDAVLAQAVYDATYAAQMFAMLTPTPAVQAQFPANGQITGNLTITGTAGLNVVNLPAFVLNNGARVLTLTGPTGTAFVINVSGGFDLHTGNIAVSGGVGPLDVVYNITNPSAKVTSMVPTTASGILLAPFNAIDTMDSASFTGEVIGGYKQSIILMSGTSVTNPCSQGSGVGPA